MMVLDGCFVLELFRGVAEGFKKLGYPRNDPVFAMRGSMHSIQEVCCEQGLNLCPEIGSGGGQMLIVLLISDANN